MNLAEVTLIVPTKNESRNIGLFLESVPAHIQTIIVDASTDETLDIIRGKNRGHIVVLRDDGNIPAARQLGADAARTEWLLFSDADVLFAEDYFTALENLRPDEARGGIAGAKLSKDRYRSYYRIFSSCLKLLCAFKIPAASGSNMLVRRQALMDAGGFDLKLSCNEDSELMWRISRHGYRIDYEGRLAVFEFDHRRLNRGLLGKTLHSMIRCTLLFCGLMPVDFRRSDWGYWRKGRTHE